MILQWEISLPNNMTRGQKWVGLKRRKRNIKETFKTKKANTWTAMDKECVCDVYWPGVHNKELPANNLMGQQDSLHLWVFVVHTAFITHRLQHNNVTNRYRGPSSFIRGGSQIKFFWIFYPLQDTTFIVCIFHFCYFGWSKYYLSSIKQHTSFQVCCKEQPQQ